MSIEFLESLSLFGGSVVDINSLGQLIFKLTINLLSMFILIRCIFYATYKDRSYVFAYTLINLSVFLLCFLLSGVKLKMGFAFGLFAVFSIIRYRTEQIPIKHMTYLFIAIMLAVLNALSNKKVPHVELILANFITVFGAFFLDRWWYRRNPGVKTIKYERIDLIRPERKDELIEDLKARTGLDITRVDISDINLLNDTAILKVHFDNNVERN